MEQHTFDSEAFNKTIVELKRLANAQETRNEKARERHNQAYFDYGPAVSSRLPDTASVNNSEEVGKVIIDFISTIPGVATEGMVKVVSNPNSIALSHRALSAFLRRNNGAEVGMSLAFAFEGWPKHKLTFERIDPEHNRVAVSFEMGVENIPLGGKIDIGTITGGQMLSTKHSITFDTEGVVTKDYPEFGLLKGEKIEIIKMIQQITTPEKLGETLNPKGMVDRIKQPKLETEGKTP